MSMFLIVMLVIFLASFVSFVIGYKLSNYNWVHAIRKNDYRIVGYDAEGDAIIREN